jgi:hypothetical protein
VPIGNLSALGRVAVPYYRQPLQALGDLGTDLPALFLLLLGLDKVRILLLNTQRVGEQALFLWPAHSSGHKLVDDAWV